LIVRRLTIASRLLLRRPASRGRARARPLPGIPDDEVTLHLLVESGAEVGAIKWKHARLGELDGKGLGLTRIHHQVDVMFDQTKAVNHVAGLLDIGHMDR